MAVSALQLSELALHGTAFLCGIISAAALTVTQGAFGGRCVLYGAAARNGTALALESSGPASLCYFVSGVSVLAALYCFAALLHGIYRCCLDEGRGGRAGLGVALAVTAAILFLLLVAAGVLRAGMDALCASAVRAAGLSSCREAQRRPWPSRDAGRFYSNLYSAQAAAWVSVAAWGGLLALLALRRRREAPFALLRRGDPEWSAETEAIFGGRPARP
ncbi:transmembrane protein 179B [Dromaius novaehollandiae]|uniref:transmembrane protein 179B n=1 Tax=Dromaius novaehollandiae TaxID=8790 RepID=UPI00311D8EC5